MSTSYSSMGSMLGYKEINELADKAAKSALELPLSTCNVLEVIFINNLYLGKLVLEKGHCYHLCWWYSTFLGYPLGGSLWFCGATTASIEEIVWSKLWTINVENKKHYSCMFKSKYDPVVRSSSCLAVWGRMAVTSVFFWVWSYLDTRLGGRSKLFYTFPAQYASSHS